MIKVKIKLNTILDIKEFLNVVSKVPYDVDLVKGRYVVDAKSVIGVYTIDLSDAAELYIHAEDNECIKLFDKWIVE